MALLIILRLLKNGFTRKVDAVWQNRRGVGSVSGVL
jgi:formate hydrogenlyase subunit 4